MVDQQIDPGARRQGGELLEQFERFEEEMPGAVRPSRLEREQNAAVAQKLKPVLADRRAQEIAAQLLEPRAVPGGHRDIGVEVEAVEMRVPGRGGDNPWGVRLLAQTPHARTRSPTQGDPPLDRSAADAGERRRFFSE